MKSTTIPVQGNKSLNLALQALSLKMGEPIGKLVADALYQKYGTELKAFEALFSSGQLREVSLTPQSDPEKSHE